MFSTFNSLLQGNVNEHSVAQCHHWCPVLNLVSTALDSRQVSCTVADAFGKFSCIAFR